MNKVLTLTGTRPELIRLSIILQKLDKACNHVHVHTMQNHDPSLYDVFIRELGLRTPDYVFEKTASIGEFLGKGFIAFEKILDEEQPDKVLILGDTNSVLFGILAAKRGIEIAHLEAGNRCNDPLVPEETNRLIIDSCSKYNLPYTDNSKENLIREGHSKNLVFKTGNPIWEVLKHYDGNINRSFILQNLGLMPWDFGGVQACYALLTFHRTENVDNPERARNVVEAMNEVAEDMVVVVSMHPRTKDQFKKHGIEFNAKVKVIEPVGFFDFVQLERFANVVFTDCLRPDTMVMHSNGVVSPISSLCKGNNILSASGAESILAVGDKKNDVKYRIRTKYNEIFGSENHRLFVMGMGGVPIEKKIKDITAKDRILSICQIYPTECAAHIKLQHVEQKNYHKINAEGNALIRSHSEGNNLRKFGRFKGNVIYNGKGAPIETIRSVLDEIDLDYDSFKQYLYVDMVERRQISINQPTYLNENIALLVGYLCGDGSVIHGDHYRLMFCDENINNLQYLKGVMMDEFGLLGTIRTDIRSQTLIYGCKSLVEFMLKNFPGECSVAGKELKDIADIIMISPDNIVKQYIRGLYEAEGFVGHHGIGITMADKNVIVKLKYLLLRFGIIANYYEHQPRREKDKCVLYQLFIYESASRYIFREKIGFISDYKKGNLDRILAVVDAQKRHKPVKRIGNIFYDLIRKIEIVEDDESYVDIHVDPSNTFMANGIVSHNSGTVPEETSLFGVPTIVLRDTTERQELMENGTLILAGTNKHNILRAYHGIKSLKQKWGGLADYNKENVSDTVIRLLLGQ